LEEIIEWKYRARFRNASTLVEEAEVISCEGKVWTTWKAKDVGSVVK
jgi:hypothetical protein